MQAGREGHAPNCITPAGALHAGLSEPIEEIPLENIPHRADKPFRPQRLDRSRRADG